MSEAETPESTEATGLLASQVKVAVEITGEVVVGATAAYKEGGEIPGKMKQELSDVHMNHV